MFEYNTLVEAEYTLPGKVFSVNQLSEMRVMLGGRWIVTKTLPYGLTHIAFSVGQSTFGLY